MNARVIATSEVVELMYSHTVQDTGYDIIWYTTPRGACFSKEELEFIDTGESLDYWTRLEHQAAIAAMGGICGNTSYDESTWEYMAEDAIWAAHVLVQKLKEKEEEQ
jgi:hypothetical protein